MSSLNLSHTFETTLSIYPEFHSRARWSICGEPLSSTKGYGRKHCSIVKYLHCIKLFSNSWKHQISTTVKLRFGNSVNFIKTKHPIKLWKCLASQENIGRPTIGKLYWIYEISVSISGNGSNFLFFNEFLEHTIGGGLARTLAENILLRDQFFKTWDTLRGKLCSAFNTNMYIDSSHLIDICFRLTHVFQKQKAWEH